MKLYDKKSKWQVALVGALPAIILFSAFRVLTTPSQPIQWGQPGIWSQQQKQELTTACLKEVQNYNVDINKYCDCFVTTTSNEYSVDQVTNEVLSYEKTGITAPQVLAVGQQCADEVNVSPTQ